MALFRSEMAEFQSQVADSVARSATECIKSELKNEFTKIGDGIDVLVLEVDVENRRLSLGHKQLEENPWDVFETLFVVGTDHKGTIVSANDKGAVVQLPYGVEAFCPNKHLLKIDGGNAKVEETVDFKVLEFNKESKKIIVSHRNTNEEIAIEEKESRGGAKKEAGNKGPGDETKKAVQKVKDNQEKTTFGDVAGLADLKSALEDKEQDKE